MLTEYTKFYHQALPPEQQLLYKELYYGIRARKSEIELHTDNRRISPDDLTYVYQSVYNDTPSFYYLHPSYYQYRTAPFGYIFVPTYLYSAEQIAKWDQQLEAGLKTFRDRYISPTMTEYEKEKAIHDYLVRTITYDKDAIKEGANIREAYNILGALLKKRAVCWGIACAFKLLCDYCRVKCFVVIGTAYPYPANEGHAWNMVKIDGEEFHVDATWDIKEKGAISFRYDYFNLDDKLIQLDHAWDSPLYPTCTSIKHNFYYKNRLFVKTLGDLTTFIANRLKANEQYIAVKYAANMPQESDVLAAIMNAFHVAQDYRQYVYQIDQKTHNIYIEIT